MTQTTTDIDDAARAFYADLDSGDPAFFQRRLADGAVFNFNDLEPVVGVAAIDEFVSAWKTNFRSLTHEIVSIAVDTARGIAGVEMVVTYVFPDGREVRLKGCSFLDFAGAAATGYRVYIDTTQLT
jgi:hypothetical protein